jgi:hypothetical protein
MRPVIRAVILCVTALVAVPVMAQETTSDTTCKYCSIR